MLMIWILISAVCVILYPLGEGRHGIFITLRGIYWDCTGQTYKLKEWQNNNLQELHMVKSQISARMHNPQVRDIIVSNLDDLIEN